jgi:CheY-like chemotaxis protein
MDAVEADSPGAALVLLGRDERFDVAVLDLQMPEMDGVALAREIRRIPTASDLPLILFSSIGRRESGSNWADFAAVLVKPLKPSQLFNALSQVLIGELEEEISAAGQSTGQLLGERYPLQILLAEDNRVNQMLAVRLLEKMGYRADIVGNGLEAVSALDQKSYDVILMDVQMPEMDGLEATRTIRNVRALDAGPRIIAMTANAMQGDREICLEAGMNDYVSKPIRTEELASALERSAQVIERERKG